jgi:hypothetical protein
MPPKNPIQPFNAKGLENDLDTVGTAGVDVQSEQQADTADKIKATDDFGLLDSTFDYGLVSQWLRQLCSRPVEEACGAFVGRALELLLRNTVDSVLGAARLRQGRPNPDKDFAGTELTVVDSAVNLRKQTAQIQKQEAEAAKARTQASGQVQAAEAAPADEGAGGEGAGGEGAGESGGKNLAVLSAFATMRRKRKASGSSSAADEAKRQKLQAARAKAQAAAGGPPIKATLQDVAWHCRNAAPLGLRQDWRTSVAALSQDGLYFWDKRDGK